MICPGFRVHINVNLLFFISKPAILNLFSRIPNSISEFHVRIPYQNSMSELHIRIPGQIAIPCPNSRSDRNSYISLFLLSRAHILHPGVRIIDLQVLHQFHIFTKIIILNVHLHLVNPFPPGAALLPAAVPG